MSRLQVGLIENALSNLPRTPALVAFSGGADSLALLAALSASGHPVTALYVNHHLRDKEELERELELNRQNCSALNVPLVVRSVDTARMEKLTVSVGVEAAARSERYRILFDYAKAHHLIVYTAHNANDQAENIVLRILNGSPLEKLAIRERVVIDSVSVVRPLLDVPHRNLESYLTKRGLVWSLDSTNSGTRFVRGRIRHTLIPLLEADGSLDLLSLAGWGASSSLWREHIGRKVSSLFDSGALMRSRYLLCPGWVRRQALFSLFDAPFRISASLIDLADGFIRTRSSGELEAGRYTLVVRDDRVRAFSLRPEGGFAFVSSALKRPGVLVFDDFELRIAKQGGKEDLVIPSARLSEPVLRSVQPADRMDTAGRDVSVFSLLKGWKIPLALRDRALVLEDRGVIVALFASFLGGRNRICTRFKHLEESGANYYIVFKRNRE